MLKMNVYMQHPRRIQFLIKSTMLLLEKGRRNWYNFMFIFTCLQAYLWPTTKVWESYYISLMWKTFQNILVKHNWLKDDNLHAWINCQQNQNFGWRCLVHFPLLWWNHNLWLTILGFHHRYLCEHLTMNTFVVILCSKWLMGPFSKI